MVSAPRLLAWSTRRAMAVALALGAALVLAPADPAPASVALAGAGRPPAAAGLASPWASPWSPPVPLRLGTVARRFEPPAHRYGPGHRGVDLEAAAHTPVRSAGAGVVAFAGMVAGRPVVSVEHPGGLRTTYEPVVPLVTAGQRVAARRVIGRLAAVGWHCPPTACLHWGARRGAAYVDPLRLLGAGPVRLLPVRTPARGPRPRSATPW
jgi:murein DD-endopeptidase MepM/ murein hydrolase activator NlpD